VRIVGVRSAKQPHRLERRVVPSHQHAGDIEIILGGFAGLVDRRFTQVPLEERVQLLLAGQLLQAAEERLRP
jgi:hypothetical protein